MPSNLASDLRLNPPAIISARELSFITGLSARTIRNRTNDGTFPRIKIGRRVLFRWANVANVLATLETKAANE